MALFSAAFFPVTRLVKGVWVMSSGHHLWGYGWFITDPLCLAFLVVMFIYFAVFEGLGGATLGKWALGLRVVRADGAKPGLVRGLARNALRVIDGLPAFNILGIVMIATSSQRTRFGDLMAGTRVIRVGRCGKQVYRAPR
jgi:uncharacterized RDD family membrane protein YckC